jgi:signal transduction histidine kinase
MVPFQSHSPEYFFILIIMTISYLYLAGVYYSYRNIEKVNDERNDLIKIENEKTRIAAEMHDDLGADLSNLLFKLRIYQNCNRELAVEEYYQIENFTKEIIKKVNELIWTLNSEKDTLNSLCNFMLKFLDEYLSAKNIGYEFNSNILQPEKHLDIEKRRAVFHLFKETIIYLSSFEEIKKLKANLKIEDKGMIISILYTCFINENLKSEQQELFDSLHQRIEYLGAIFDNNINVSGENEIKLQIEI